MGTPLYVLQELGGWESAEMVRKYPHLSSEHLAQYVDQFFRLRLVVRDDERYESVTDDTEKKGCIAATL